MCIGLYYLTGYAIPLQIYAMPQNNLTIHCFFLIFAAIKKLVQRTFLYMHFYASG